MLRRVRTTLDIADEILRQAKKRAADERVPLRKLVEDALRSYLSGRRARRAYRLKWTTERGGLRPGVDLDDRKRLLDLMDGLE
jgi:hypothetical protein